MLTANAQLKAVEYQGSKSHGIQTTYTFYRNVLTRLCKHPFDCRDKSHSVVDTATPKFQALAFFYPLDLPTLISKPENNPKRAADLMLT